MEKVEMIKEMVRDILIDYTLGVWSDDFSYASKVVDEYMNSYD